ncbi:hypothetical protein F5Y18DRAFT_421525 [Xylariaceae sp. FL1019]|nr:hypothetical protein F5Y18DRAFT_421525 [Xylariaceae sp. FL1019]
MHFTLSIIVASALFGSSLAQADIRDIDIYPDSAVCNDHDGTGLQCGNIGSLVCCQDGGRDIFSAQCRGLNTQDVADQCVIAINDGPGTLSCKTALKAESGNSIICLDPDTSPAATGAFWVELRQKRSFRRGQAVQCTSSVKPDKAFFGSRSFRINYDVPTNVTDYLMGLIKTDPSLSNEIPGDVLKYEIAK